MANTNIADLMGNRYGHLPWRKNIITVSTASTATYEISPHESGSILKFGTVSTIYAQLPKISSKFLGLNYEIYFSTADDPDDYHISCIDSSAAIQIIGLTTDGIGTATTIKPASTDCPFAIRVTAISSVIWMGEPITNGWTSDYQAHSAGAWTTA
jgi:hypothetical protein